MQAKATLNMRLQLNLFTNLLPELFFLGVRVKQMIVLVLFVAEVRVFVECPRLQKAILDA